MAVRRLPSLHAQWNAYKGTDFIQYNVYVREHRAVYDAREVQDTTISGCVTDSMRGLGREGDGREYPDESVGVWPGATNYVLNGSVENDTSDHSMAGTGNSHVRSTDVAKFGTYSLKKTFESGGTDYFGYATFTMASAVAHYATVWAYIPTSWDGGQLTSHLVSLTGVSGTTSADFNMALRDQWQKLTIGPFTPGGDLTGSFETYISSGGSPTVGRYFYLDAWQVEETRVTPFITTSGASASRANGRVQLPCERLNAADFGFAIRLRTNWSNSAEPLGGSSEVYVLDVRLDADNNLRLYYKENNNQWVLARRVDGLDYSVTVNDTIAVDQEITLVGYGRPTEIGLSVDGAAITTVSTPEVTDYELDLFDLGSLAGAQHAYADFFWGVFFSDVPSTADLATFVGFGNDAPAPEDLTSLIDAHPIMVWDARFSDQAIQVENDDWVNVAVIDDQGQTSFDYLSPSSGQDYEFTVTVTANVFGDIIESDKQTPVHDSVTFTSWVLQEVDDENPRFSQVSAGGAEVSVEQEIAFVRPRGRTAPTAQIGEFEASTITFSGVPLYHATERTEWNQVIDMVRRQRTHASVYLLRAPHRPERWYVQLDPLARADDIPVGSLSVNFRQVHYSESV